MQRLVIGVLNEIHYIDESCLWLFSHPARHVLHVPVCKEIVKLSELGARYSQTWIPWHIYLLIYHHRHVGAASLVWMVIILIFFIFIDLIFYYHRSSPVSINPIETAFAHSWLSNKGTASSPLQWAHRIALLAIAARSLLVTTCLWLTRALYFLIWAAVVLQTIHALTQNRVQRLCDVASERLKFV